MKYGYQYKKEFPESMDDYIFYAMTNALSMSDVDTSEILERLSKFDYDNEDCVKLRKFVIWRSDNPDKEPEQFFDDDLDKGKRELINFVTDVSETIERACGCRWLLPLTITPEMDNPDDIVEQFEIGKPLFTDTDMVTVYGYAELPHSIEPTNEQIRAALESVDLVYRPSSSEIQPLSDQEVYNILQSKFPAESFDETVEYLYEDLIAQHKESVVDSIRKDLPMWSREDIEEYLYQNTDGIRVDFSTLLDEEYCCYIELNDSSFPIVWDNGAHFLENSTLSDICKQMGYTVPDVERILTDGLPAKKISSFPESLVNEFDVSGTSPDQSMVFLKKMTLSDILYKDYGDFKIEKGTRCGFFNPFKGSGGDFGIMIEKDLTIPRDKATLRFDFRPSDSRMYSIRETYSSLEDGLWDPIYTFQKKHEHFQGR